MNCRGVAGFMALCWAPAFTVTIPAAPPPGYYLVWSDEFNRTSLDTTKWDYWLTGSWRDAVNTSGAVSLNGSNMIITTYTSGGVNDTAMLATDKSFHSRYGYWEANIKWGDTNGMWSALWLRSPTMGTYLDDYYASGAEIDIAEHRYVGIYGTYIGNIVSDNIHWNGYGSQEQSTGSPNVGTGLDAGFHTYGLLWTHNSYSFSIDGSQVWDGGTTPPFGSDAYLILSSEVDDTSTTWAGYIPTGGYPSQAASNVKMTVDYVRYYAPTNVLFWTGASSANWNNPANWVSNLPPASNSDLTFSYLSGNRTMTLGQDYSVDGLIFLNSSNAFSINGVNTLTLGAGGLDMVAANNNVTLNSAIKISANQTWAVGPNNPGSILTANATISGSGVLTKASHGLLVLTASNSFSGTLNVDTGSAITNDGAVLAANSAALANVTSVILRNTGIAVSALLLSNSVTVPAVVTFAGRNTNVPAIQSMWGNNQVAGGLKLTGGGSNYLVESDSSGFSVGGTISASGTAAPCMLTLQGTGNFSVSASIQNGSSSSLSIVKTNALALTLAGTNTFTGGTTNFRGNLFINGSLAGPLTIKSGILSGVGSVGGDTILQTPQGGTCELSPGTAIANAIGTLSFSNNLTLAPGTMTFLEINATTMTNDSVSVGGTLACGGTLFVNSMGGPPGPGQSFQLFRAGTIAGSFSIVTLPPLNAGLAWNTNQLGAGIISVIAVSPAETLGMTPAGSGQIQLNWSYGALQSATNIAGPFNSVTGVTAPYVVPMTSAQQFFRVKED